LHCFLCVLCVIEILEKKLTRILGKIVFRYFLDVKKGAVFCTWAEVRPLK